jgi:hypothetical protein
VFILKVTELSPFYRTPPACAKRAAYPDPPPVVPWGRRRRWKETWKRGDECRGGGGEYEGVDEGEMEGLHSLLHTVGFFDYFPFQVLSVLVTKPTDSTREREGEGEER